MVNIYVHFNGHEINRKNVFVTKNEGSNKYPLLRNNCLVSGLEMPDRDFFLTVLVCVGVNIVCIGSLPRDVPRLLFVPSLIACELQKFLLKI